MVVSASMDLRRRSAMAVRSAVPHPVCYAVSLAICCVASAETHAMMPGSDHFYSCMTWYIIVVVFVSDWRWKHRSISYFLLLEAGSSTQ